MEMLTTKQVCALTTLSRVTIWRYEVSGMFPARVQLGPKRVAWHKAEVEAWMKSRQPVLQR
ncbi:TPA: AlpA family phage regulatory protein [Klebsiella pneumoniae]|uniref:helix-turn-helix transcriptional regulator n=2 Tax=Klebsiella pneumoniae TaxID=573 RepID=UPI000CE3B7DD|nr:AlpA family phage regulatory protein [Klebsiella pneumoniae]EKX5120692.1 AlpA family phage regulatory protein [Klebsiella pneumoniae]HBW4528624.1 AlpA family phage regulatory protein [Klebsiella pneumoniae]HBW4549290.1 AlpA family phage regulatory protein [Klebsiella pneumoniae]HBW4593470.1 AlpA family phage regulatory protein [Klebsiella pneumoniae]HBW4599174.1 AlpA family phage regulatory protein [Klebsiella pneumoniae]